MHTRMGTNVVDYRGKPDMEGYLECQLEWTDGSSEWREIHIGDLRTESEAERDMIDRFSLWVSELQRLDACQP